MTQLTKAEALKSEKQEKERELQQLTETSGASGHQKLRVCDICGAYLSVLDSDRRLADHFGGKVRFSASRSLLRLQADLLALADASRLPPASPDDGRMARSRSPPHWTRSLPPQRTSGLQRSSSRRRSPSHHRSSSHVLPPHPLQQQRPSRPSLFPRPPGTRLCTRFVGRIQQRPRGQGSPGRPGSPR